MTLRAAPILVALLAIAAAAPGSDLVPSVVGVFRSPGDLRAICVAGGSLVATSEDGGRWSVTVDVLTETVRRPSAAITPSWHASGTSGPPACDGAASPEVGGDVDGFPVTARVRFASESLVATLGGGLRRASGGGVAASPPDIHGLASLGDLLLLAHSGGLAVFDGRVVTPVRLEGPPVADITAIEWGDGALWIGSFDHGLARMRGGRWETVGAGDAHGADWINSLCWDGAGLWVGSAAGLGRWVPGGDRVLPEPGVDGPVQRIGCRDPEMVVATTAAVWTGSARGWRKIDLAGEALHTAVVFDGELWTAGQRGILRRRDGDWVRFSELNGALPDSWVTALLPDGGSLWAGTYDAGLLRRDRGGAWRTIILDAWVNPNAVAPVPDGVAVGTMGDGLLLYHAPSRRWQRLRSADGLPSDDVTALLAVGDILWVGTRAGLAEVRWARRPLSGGGLSRDSGSSPRAP